ncbi:MAG: hypothetical protein JXR58_11160 [Bacteroidales bacterium]|nr:hypothetical protein [Bacteroidales bacterium]
MSKIKFSIALLTIILIGFSNCKNNDNPNNDPKTYIVTDDGSGVGTTTWKTGNTYILAGRVFVNDGQVLTIEPGVVVKGRAGEGENASALIVARGGKIYAEGSAEKPIIFTAESDNLTGNIDYLEKGLWGGVIILGNAALNSEPGESSIEGIPIGEPRGIYGGNVDSDNSGVFKYVSIRHGGSNIGEGNEINGLTLGGVGSGTTIEFVEVISNKDDGFEFFGGTVVCKHLISAFNGDDAFDYDEGWRGKGQFWLAVQDVTDNISGDFLGEHDGGTNPENGIPFATPDIYNVTYFGKGSGNANGTIIFRNNAGGNYVNSIFLNQDKGIEIEILASTDHSYARLIANDLSIRNNIFTNVAEDSISEIIKIVTDPYNSNAADAASISSANIAIANYFLEKENSFEDSGLQIQNSENKIKVIPQPGGPAFSNIAPYPSGLESVNYKGAFGTENWAEGWTLVNAYILH